jgi:hypothetical protein
MHTCRSHSSSWFCPSSSASPLSGDERTTIGVASQLLGLSRMDLPFLLGTIFVEDADRARVVSGPAEPRLMPSGGRRLNGQPLGGSTLGR